MLEGCVTKGFGLIQALDVLAVLIGGGVQKVSTVQKGGHGKFYPVLRGGGSTISFGPTISHLFCSHPLLIINDWSVIALRFSNAPRGHYLYTH